MINMPLVKAIVSGLYYFSWCCFVTAIVVAVMRRKEGGTIEKHNTKHNDAQKDSKGIGSA